MNDPESLVHWRADDRFIEFDEFHIPNGSKERSVAWKPECKVGKSLRGEVFVFDESRDVRRVTCFDCIIKAMRKQTKGNT
jgi:hypothetical protein